MNGHKGETVLELPELRHDRNVFTWIEEFDNIMSFHLVRRVRVRLTHMHGDGTWRFSPLKMASSDCQKKASNYGSKFVLLWNSRPSVYPFPFSQAKKPDQMIHSTWSLSLSLSLSLCSFLTCNTVCMATSQETISSICNSKWWHKYIPCRIYHLNVCFPRLIKTHLIKINK